MKKLLIVEDNFEYRKLLGLVLSSFFDLRFAGDMAGVDNAVAADRFDAVLLDLSLPDSFSEDTLAAVKCRIPKVAIVVLSGNSCPDLIRRTIAGSASNYLIKGQDDCDPQVLASSIRQAIQTNEACQL